MEQKNLLLSAHRKSWQVSSLHGTQQDPDKKSAKIFERILDRDKNTCYYCGFQAAKWQEVHHLNDDHEDLSLDNLVTICPLCHQSFHLNLVHTTNGGTIIWLPEFTQQELNYLCRSIFICLDASDEELEGVKFQKMAMSIYQALDAREQVVSQHFYSGTATQTNEKNVGAFGQMLLNLNEEEYNNRENIISNFKLLPSPNRFPVQIKYWKNTTFHDLPIKSWEKMINEQGDESDDN